MKLRKAELPRRIRKTKGEIAAYIHEFVESGNSCAEVMGWEKEYKTVRTCYAEFRKNIFLEKLENRIGVRTYDNRMYIYDMDKVKAEDKGIDDKMKTILHRSGRYPWAERKEETVTTGTLSDLMPGEQQEEEPTLRDVHAKIKKERKQRIKKEAIKKDEVLNEESNDI